MLKLSSHFSYQVATALLAGGWVVEGGADLFDSVRENDLE